MSRYVTFLLLLLVSSAGCKEKSSRVEETPRSIAVLAGGGAVVLATTTRTTAIGYGAVIASFDAEGNPRWRRSLWDRTKTQRTRALVATDSAAIVAFFGSLDAGTRVVLLSREGEPIWSVDAPAVGGLFETAFLTDELAVLVSSLSVVALERESGAVRWIRPVSNVASAAVVRGGSVVVRGTDLRVTLFRARDGRVRELESGCVVGDELVSIEHAGLTTTNLDSFEQAPIAPFVVSGRLELITCYRADSMWDFIGRLRGDGDESLVALRYDASAHRVVSRSETDAVRRLELIPSLEIASAEPFDVQVAATGAWVFERRSRTWKRIELEGMATRATVGGPCWYAVSNQQLTTISKKTGRAVARRGVERDTVVAAAGDVAWMAHKRGRQLAVHRLATCEAGG